MGSYKDTKEWIALNNIWKNSSQEVRNNSIKDFEILTELIKERYLVRVQTNNNYNIVENNEIVNFDNQTNKSIKNTAKENKELDYSYLDEVSPKAKQLVIYLVENGEKNLYHSIMAIISFYRNELNTIDSLWEYYVKKYQNKRPYILDYENEIREIMALCLLRMYHKKIIS